MVQVIRRMRRGVDAFQKLRNDLRIARLQHRDQTNELFVGHRVAGRKLLQKSLSQRREFTRREIEFRTGRVPRERVRCSGTRSDIAERQLRQSQRVVPNIRSEAVLFQRRDRRVQTFQIDPIVPPQAAEMKSHPLRRVRDMFKQLGMKRFVQPADDMHCSLANVRIGVAKCFAEIV